MSKTDRTAVRASLALLKHIDDAGGGSDECRDRGPNWQGDNY